MVILEFAYGFSNMIGNVFKRVSLCMKYEYIANDNKLKMPSEIM